MKKGKIKQPEIKSNGRLSIPDYTNTINYSELNPAFSFSLVQKDYCLSTWQSEKIKILIKKLAYMENFKWSELAVNNFLKFKKVNKAGLTAPIPSNITDDVDIYYFQPCGSRSPYRVFGIKERHNFKFIWFDPNHRIYPGNYK